MVSSFHRDLARSKRNEARVIELLGRGRALTRDEQRQGDVRVTLDCGSSLTLELKEDFAHARTGNVAVEYECRGRRSGIMASEADYWVYTLHSRGGPPTYWLIDPLDLQVLCSGQRTVTGGDKGSNTKMFLVPGAEFRSVAVPLSGEHLARAAGKGYGA